MIRALRSQILITILTGGVIALLFALVCPQQLYIQEQYQLFLWNWNYAKEILMYPGGVADWLGRFCTQFMANRWTGGIVLGVLLAWVQWHAGLLVDGSRFHAMSLIPSFLLAAYMLDENALLGGVLAVLICQLAAWGLRNLHGMFLRSIVFLVATPLLYRVVGPIALCFALMHLMFEIRHRRQSQSLWRRVSCGIILLTVVEIICWPWLISTIFPVSYSQAVWGFHYYRVPDAHPWWLFSAAWSLVLISCISIWIHRRNERQWRSIYLALSSLGMAAALTLGLVTLRDTAKERSLRSMHLTVTQQWDTLLHDARRTAPSTPQQLAALNLALAMQHRLGAEMFHFEGQSRASLLPHFEGDAISPLIPAEIYFQLGMTNTAQRFTFEAQEAIPDGQKSALCYRRLAETNLINGSLDVARKYLLALRQTLFYAEWATQMLQLVDHPERIDRHPVYGRMRQLQQQADFTFNEDTPDRMLGPLLMSNVSNTLALEYLGAYLLLEGRLDDLAGIVQYGASAGLQPLPRHWQEALSLWWSRNHSDLQGISQWVSPDLTQPLAQFYQSTASPGTTPQQLDSRFGNTYWYYFFTHFAQ